MTDQPPNNVHKLELVTVGEGFRFDCDEILEAAKGQGFTKLLIVGDKPSADLWVSGNANFGETLILMELAKLQVLGAKL